MLMQLLSWLVLLFVLNAVGQILAVSLLTGVLSSFMNNVGAIGLILPTAKRMAARAQVARGAYGKPLAYASILGGSVTLIGTASNVIVSTFRRQAIGESFSMFDYSWHGLAMCGTGLALWFICGLCGFKPLPQEESAASPWPEQIQDVPPPVRRSRRNTLLVLAVLLPVLVLTSMGLIHPAIGFGLAVILFIVTGILQYGQAYQALNMPVLIFLGSMLGLARILEETGALLLIVERVIPFSQGLPPFLLVMVFLVVSAFLANILDNSVAAVLMSPVAIALYQTGAVTASIDGLLMAVAAGSGLGLVLPTHQATIVTMTSMDFSRRQFIRTGLVIALTAGLAASIVITTVWC